MLRHLVRRLSMTPGEVIRSRDSGVRFGIDRPDTLRFED